MEKYIKVGWPEYQKFIGMDGVYYAWDPKTESSEEMMVPEELYNQVTR